MPTTEEMTILLKMKDQATGAMKQAGKGLDQYKTQIRAAGLGITALGGGVEALARKQRPLLEATKKLALQTGLTEKEITGMATELSNATFPLEEVVGLMEQGSKQGLEGAEALKTYANFWDTVGDATGLSSQALAKSGAALKAVGIEVGQESQLLGAFGLITTQTSGDVGAFLKSVERLAPEMGRMGLSVDEAAGIMAALENELGLTAKTARAEFKEAMDKASSGSTEVAERVKNLKEHLAGVEESFKSGAITQAQYDDQVNVLTMSIDRENARLEESKGSLAAVLETMGLTEAQVAKYTAQIDENAGVIQANADAHASTRTTMEQFQSKLADVGLQMAPYINQASALAPLLLALGPATMALSAAKTIYTTATTIATTATTAFGIALRVAMGPVGLIVIAITGLIAVGVLLYKNWDEVSAKAKEIWGRIKAFFQRTWEQIKDIFTENWRLILAVIFPPVGIALLIQQNWGKITGIVQDIWDRVVGIVTDRIDRIKSVIDGAMSAIRALASAASRVTSLIPGREHGGPVQAGQPYIVGERRPEVFVPGQNGTILPSVPGRGGSGGSIGGPSITIGTLLNVQGDANAGDLADLLENALDELARRTGVDLRTVTA